jgi:para-nitrobenzyl esterase
VYENDLYVFKGIPYAAPPVGELRWMPPQPMKPWDGVRPAVEFGAISPQNVMLMPPPSPSFAGVPQNEDCLFLNIWTPGLDDARRPVMVWIHGGAFILGAGTEPVILGGKLAAHGDVVMVSINYRLGALGFINLKEITGGKIPASGNEGLFDQITAVDWVHENIQAFGGNPDNITIFGFSAGGMSIGTLLGMPAARNKFQKAIAQSGAANTVGSLDDAVSISGQYLKIFGLNGGNVEAIRSLSVEKLLDGQQELGMRVREAEHRATPFQPVVDGQTLPERPIEAIRGGSARDVAVIVGTALEEWKGLGAREPGIQDLDDAGLLARLSSLLPSDFVPGLVNAYQVALQKRGGEVTPYEVLAAIQTDLMFRMPAIHLVEAQRDNSTPAYNYLFTHKSPIMCGILGACHGLDNHFIFGNLVDDVCGSGPDMENLSRKIQDAWTAFARTGNPSCQSTGEWPIYGKERMTMLLGKDNHVEKAPYDQERRAWDNFNMTFTRPI